MSIILHDTPVPVPIRWMKNTVEWVDIVRYRWRKWESTTTLDDHGKRLFWAALAYRMGFGRLAPDPTILMATFAATTTGIAITAAFRGMKIFVEECPIPRWPFTPQIAPAIALPFMAAVLLIEANLALLWTAALCLGVAVYALHRTEIFLVFARYISGQTMCENPERVDVVKEVRA